MTSNEPSVAYNFKQTLHPLSDADRQAEQLVLASIEHHFSGFVGSHRQAYDALTAQTPISTEISCECVEAEGVKGWWVRPRGARIDQVIMFLHGGAYMLGSAEAYRGFASQIAVRTGAATFVLDYPLAPEHPFPAAYDAVAQACRWLGTQGAEQLALVGDSAGGGLALAALNQYPASAPSVASVVAFSPWVDLSLSGASMQDPATFDPIFRPSMLEAAALAYLAGGDPSDPRASPLFANPHITPPIAIQVGADELLLDDSRRYASAAAARRGKVELEVYEGLHHVFQRSAEQLLSARRALDTAGRFIKRSWLAVGNDIRLSRV